MYTDTVSPHSEGMKFAIDYYGIDHVMYGTDYPCWDPAPCLKLLEDVTLSRRRQAEAVLRQRAAHPRPEGPGAGEDEPSASRRWCRPRRLFSPRLLAQQRSTLASPSPLEGLEERGSERRR